MLNKQAVLVRDLVRYDTRQNVHESTNRLLLVLECCADFRISDKNNAVREMLLQRRHVDLANFVTQLSRGPARSVRNSRELTVELASVHQGLLGTESPMSPKGTEARRALHQCLAVFGLVVETRLPISVALVHRQRQYLRIAHDAERLAVLIHESLGEAIEIGQNFIESHSQMRYGWIDKLAPKLGSVLDVTLMIALSQGELILEDVVKRTGANKSNASRAVDSLEELGLLQEMTGRRKNKHWLSPQIIDLLEQTLATKTF